MVDIEADGPIPGDYSMVCFGAIVVEPSLEKTFYGQLKPISESFLPANRLGAKYSSLRPLSGISRSPYSPESDLFRSE
jgi:hypothetical protein